MASIKKLIQSFNFDAVRSVSSDISAAYAANAGGQHAGEIAEGNTDNAFVNRRSPSPEGDGSNGLRSPIHVGSDSSSRNGNESDVSVTDGMAILAIKEEKHDEESIDNMVARCREADNQALRILEDRNSHMLRRMADTDAAEVLEPSPKRARHEEQPDKEPEAPKDRG
jgi:hypothetical protein